MMKMRGKIVSQCQPFILLRQVMNSPNMWLALRGSSWKRETGIGEIAWDTPLSPPEHKRGENNVIVISSGDDEDFVKTTTTKQ